MRKHLRRLCPSIPALCVLLAPSLVAGQPPDDPSATERPRVGLVLGGGGARGAAHIGVLKELERLRVPIDAIAGTSMGAIVGGLYASGRSATELEELVASLDWAVALSDESNRENLSFRRKQDEREVPIDFNVGIQGTDFVLPKGAIQGQKLDLLLRDLTKDVSHVHDYDDLPIPFRAIASDIEHGEPWVMGEGDLARSIRASMSVPAVFAPVVVDGRLLADGGLVGNLPIEVMRDMDVDVIIAVDVAFPLYSRDELDSALTISEQIVTILIGKETRRQVELLGAGDILIRPELGQFSSSDFGSITNAVEPGAQATRDYADQLADLALDPAAWERYAAARSRPGAGETPLAFVRIVHDGTLATDVLEARLTVAAGDPIDHEVLARNADILFGLQVYEQVGYRLVEESGGVGVEFEARSRTGAPGRLRFGMVLENDFEGSTAFNLSVRMTHAGINPLGAEWRNDLSLGTDSRLQSEFYQPLRLDSRLFVAPRITAKQTNLNEFSGDRPVARYRLTEGEAGFDVGRELANVGEFRIGLFRGLGKADVRIGDSGLQDIDFDTGGAHARLRFDTLDNAFFPRHGLLGDLRWTVSSEGLGASYDFETLEGTFTAAASRGKNTLQVGLEYATTLDSSADPLNQFTLGGFRRLSGLETDALSGPHLALARVVYYRRFGESATPLDTPVYLGMSAETGNVWQDRSDMGFSSMLWSGSVFVGFDTLIGPVHIAAGYTEDSRSSFYLVVGSPPR
jgi:NTE family protein